MNRRASIVMVIGPPLVDGWREANTFEPWVLIAGLVIGIGGAWWWRRQSKIRRL